MTPNDPHLLNLFFGLQEEGLLLTLDDYDLLQQAWSKGFQVQTVEELEQLCRRLWVRSLDDRQCFDRYFQIYRQQWDYNSSRSTSPVQAKVRTSQTTSSTTPEQPKEPPNLPQPAQTQTTDTFDSPQIAQAIPQSEPDYSALPKYFTLSDENYFPVSPRQLLQGWKSLYSPQQITFGTEPDILATVQRVSQQGFFLEPVKAPQLQNQIELILLVDQSNSMQPLAPLTQQLISATQAADTFGRSKIYYFRNCPKDAVYRDREMLDKVWFSTLLPACHRTRTIVMVFSDGGAARGGFNPDRWQLTDEFLSQIQPVVRQVMWFNPFPPARWLGTTADLIADRVPMFPFTLADWRGMIQALRGQVQLPEHREILADWNGASSVAENIKNRLQPLHPEIANAGSKYEQAAQRIVAWAKRGQAYVDLACHAAFPLALTPKLLYFLWQNFSNDTKGCPLDIPWLAVSDLLLSPLCQPTGHQLYEMGSVLRHLLLQLLLADDRFGSTRLNHLSEALLFYIHEGLEESNFEAQDFGEKPQWIALAYTAPNEAARQLAQMLQQTYGGDKATKVRWTSLTTALTEPLAEAGFQPLLTYARGMKRLAWGNEEAARQYFDRLSSQRGTELQVEGIALKLPQPSKELDSTIRNPLNEWAVPSLFQKVLDFVNNSTKSISPKSLPFQGLLLSTTAAAILYCLDLYAPDAIFTKFCAWCLSDKNPQRKIFIQTLGVFNLVDFTVKLFEGILSETELQALLPYCASMNTYLTFEPILNNVEIGLARPKPEDVKAEDRREVLKAFNTATIERLHSNHQSAHKLLSPIEKITRKISLFKSSDSPEKLLYLAATSIRDKQNWSMQDLNASLQAVLIANAETCNEVVQAIAGLPGSDVVHQGLVDRYASVNDLLASKSMTWEERVHLGTHAILVVPTIGYYVTVLANEIRPMEGFAELIEDGTLYTTLYDAALLVRLLNDLGTPVLKMSGTERKQLVRQIKECWETQFTPTHTLFEVLEHFTETSTELTQICQDARYGKYNLALDLLPQDGKMTEILNVFEQNLNDYSELYSKHWQRLMAMADRMTKHLKDDLISQVFLRVVKICEISYSDPAKENPFVHWPIG